MGLYFVQTLIVETVMGRRRVQEVFHHAGLAETDGAAIIMSGTTNATTRHTTRRVADDLLGRFSPDDLARCDVGDLITPPFLIPICVSCLSLKA
jgi:hypothetical protein